MKKLLKTENIVAVLFFLFVALFPMGASKYEIENFSNFYVTVVMALSVALIWGYCGIFSFGQCVFYGLGAYGYSLISLATGSTVLGVLVGILAAALVSLLLGYFIFYGKVNGLFIGILTLCLATMMETFMVQTSGPAWTLFGVPLGGFNGINNVPRLELFGIKFKGMEFYVLIALVMLAVYLGMRKLTHSKWGYALVSVRESKDRSEMFGYNTAKIQTLVFTAGGALAGLAGAMFSACMSYATPSTMGLTASAVVLVMVAAGGRKNPTAVMVTTLAYTWFAQVLAAAGNQYSNIILGLVLVFVILFLPDGILATFFRWTDQHVLSKFTGRKKRAAGVPAKEKA